MVSQFLFCQFGGNVFFDGLLGGGFNGFSGSNVKGGIGSM